MQPQDSYQDMHIPDELNINLNQALVQYICLQTSNMVIEILLCRYRCCHSRKIRPVSKTQIRISCASDGINEDFYYTVRRFNYNDVTFFRSIIVIVVFSISCSMTSAAYGMVYFSTIPLQKQRMNIDFMKSTDGS